MNNLHTSNKTNYIKANPKFIVKVKNLEISFIPVIVIPIPVLLFFNIYIKAAPSIYYVSRKYPPLSVTISAILQPTKISISFS